MNDKEFFIFYKSYNNAIQRIKKSTLRLQAYEIIINYSLYGTEPQTDNDTLLAMFELIKPIIDSNDKRRQTNIENGKKGGAPKMNKNACKKQPKTTQNNPKTTKNKPKSQNKRRENKEEGIKNKEERIKNREKEIMKENAFSLINANDLERFKILYPEKEISESIFVPQDFNFDLLLEAINKSDFLKNCNNLSLQWLIDNYDKVIQGEYQNYTKDTKDMWANMAEVFSNE